MRIRHEKTTLSTELEKLFGDKYKEHIKEGMEYIFCFPGESDVYKETKISWHHIVITYVRSDVAFYVVKGYPEIKERHFDMGSYMASSMMFAELDPKRDIEDLTLQESLVRFDDTHTKVINWNNSKYSYLNYEDGEDLYIATFKVDKVIEHIIGKGTVICFKNENNFPINTKSYVVFEMGGEEVPIRGVEGSMLLMDPPFPSKNMSIVISHDYYDQIKKEMTIYTDGSTTEYQPSESELI